jgi:hypothetical protein
MIYLDTMGHLTSDQSGLELFEFAIEIGLKREWFQDKGPIPHFDLTTKRMFNRAVAHGATLVPPKELVKKYRAKFPRGVGNGL